MNIINQTVLIMGIYGVAWVLIAIVVELMN
jgi:hypothetical protein